MTQGGRVGLIGKKILEIRTEAMGKSIHELNAEFVKFCVCEKEKNNIFEIAVIIFKTFKSSIQKGF